MGIVQKYALIPGRQDRKEVVALHSRQKKPKQGGQKLVVRVMAILLALMFVLSLSSQILFYVGAEDLGSSGELKARQEQLSQQREDTQRELDTLFGEEGSAVERYRLTAHLDELVSAQVETDAQLEELCRSECRYLRKAREELLTAVNDQEVVLECGQETLEDRLAQVEEQLDQRGALLEEVRERLEEERSDLKALEASLDSITEELTSDSDYQLAVQELSETDENLEEDILTEDTDEAVKRSPLYLAETVETFVRGKKPSSSHSKASKVKGSEVAQFAVQFVGMPYKWGGESLTEGCDCSGFIKSVFANFGIELPHFSGSLQHAGTAVEYDDARLGDLICYDGHVGIYLGNDKMVNAFDSRHGIIICSVNIARLVTVRRVV